MIPSTTGPDAAHRYLYGRDPSLVVLGSPEHAVVTRQLIARLAKRQATPPRRSRLSLWFHSDGHKAEAVPSGYRLQRVRDDFEIKS